MMQVEKTADSDTHHSATNLQYHSQLRKTPHRSVRRQTCNSRSHCPDRHLITDPVEKLAGATFKCGSVSVSLIRTVRHFVLVHFKLYTDKCFDFSNKGVFGALVSRAVDEPEFGA